ncbi:E3 ubiquitin/ISG15 ligase TRIM25-like isoform X2 [Denticeps clupeoides]|uniref:E3 ubiquitin/ISG15 ligase TRIM25-like isoform X2 n=1 Tax=Denticeps clupeoides TaxID=299321 RepID=UPI0010A32E01|nr:E3 ubiquitin/ISG15 ligase TRIM25-like isoform X2 [Denticeps clupeoides]
MAAGFSEDQDLFMCSVCLDLLKDPVTLPCGHSYCMICIKNSWDAEDQKGVYSCPQCRETFTSRPVVKKNTVMTDIIENLRKMKLRTAGDVECDVCTGRKVKAVKSCLVCLVSYCETHFKVHNEVNPGGKHKVTDATGHLEEKICSQHHKLLEVFCRTDQKCVCLMCVMDEHKNHDSVSAAAGRSEKQEQLVETRRRSHQRLEKREEELQKLREAVETLKRSAQAAVEDSEKIFTQMICSIEKRRSDVSLMIRDQEKAELSRAEGRLVRLEQEIIDLRRRDAELEQLSHTEDHIHFLQSFPSLCVPPGSKDLSKLTVNQSFSFETVMKSVFALREQLEDCLEKEVENIYRSAPDLLFTLFTRRSKDDPPMMSGVKTHSPSAPKTREDFLQWHQGGAHSQLAGQWHHLAFHLAHCSTTLFLLARRTTGCGPALTTNA